MQYIILESWSAAGLEANVTLHLREGWSLQGGVSIAYSPGGSLMYAQAMIKHSS